MDTMAKRLKYFREREGFSIREVAALMKVSPSTYRGWEFGAEIKGEPYLQLAKLYNVSLVQLMTGKTSDIEIQLETIESALKIIRTTL